MRSDKLSLSSLESTTGLDSIHQFPLGDGMKHKSQPMLAHHMTQSFIHRVWLEIELQFLAFNLLQFAFSVCIKEYLSDEDVLEFSFHAFSGCGRMLDFLNVLATICLQCKNEESFRSRKSIFQNIWDKRESEKQALYNYALETHAQFYPHAFGIINELFTRLRSV